MRVQCSQKVNKLRLHILSMNSAVWSNESNAPFKPKNCNYRATVCRVFRVTVGEWKCGLNPTCRLRTLLSRTNVKGSSSFGAKIFVATGIKLNPRWLLQSLRFPFFRMGTAGDAAMKTGCSPRSKCQGAKRQKLVPRPLHPAWTDLRGAHWYRTHFPAPVIERLTSLPIPLGYQVMPATDVHLFLSIWLHHRTTRWNAFKVISPAVKPWLVVKTRIPTTIAYCFANFG